MPSNRPERENFVAERILSQSRAVWYGSASRLQVEVAQGARTSRRAAPAEGVALPPNPCPRCAATLCGCALSCTRSRRSSAPPRAAEKGRQPQPSAVSAPRYQRNSAHRLSLAVQKPSKLTVDVKRRDSSFAPARNKGRPDGRGGGADRMGHYIFREAPSIVERSGANALPQRLSPPVFSNIASGKPRGG
jgi:hypothetical protein